MNRKSLLLGVGLSFACSLFGLDLSRQSSEMNDAYKIGFYPGVVRFADEILNTDTNSVYAPKAYLLKGECLFRMGRIEDALECLVAAENLVKDSKDLAGQLNFWKGRCFLELEEYDQAQMCFYEACSKSALYFDQGVLFAGRTYYAQKNFDKAIPLYQQVIGNGSKYQMSDYEKSCVELLTCYNVCQKYESVLGVCRNLEDAGFSQNTSFLILLEKGDALKGLGRYRDSYDVYCQVLSEGPSNLAAIAMQKAYYVSNQHKTEVGTEPGKIISDSQPRLAQYPELLSEFWTRLAIDAFDSAEYEKSLTYFSNARENASRLLQQIAYLYRAEIALITTKGTESQKAQSAAAVLKEADFVPEDELYDHANLCQARIMAMQEKWKECREFAELVKKSGEPSLVKAGDYWWILSYYEQNELKIAYENVRTKNYDGKDFLILKAKILAKNGFSSEADRIFYDLGMKGQLDNDGRLDYTRTLLNAGHLISATEQSNIAKGAEADYMAGLAAFNRGRWEDASKKFSSCMNSPALSKIHRSYARFYLGYALYRLGDFQKSFSNLSIFVADSSGHPLLWNGCEAAAKSALQNGDYANAILMAEKAVKYARNDDEKKSSIILCAGTYSDAARYDEALKILSPYQKKSDSFGFDCRYKMAQIQVLKKDYSAAEKTYLALSKESDSNPYADEAFYHYAELSYTQGRYKEAAGRFEDYCSKWKWNGGQFVIPSQYYSADCYLKTGSSTKAKLYYQQIVEDKDAGTYRYGSQKALISLYKNDKEYDKAIITAQNMINEYGKQSEYDRISEQLKELKMLSSGENYELLSKTEQFESAGKEKNRNGRKLGSELALLYYDASLKDDAQKLAEKLLPLQKGADEAGEAASNANLLGKIYREKLLNKKAAEKYLEAAKFYRMSGNENEGARALYSAAEAFDAAQLYGDSKAVIRNMKEIYPDSNWTNEAQKLLSM